jgi:hypothetical protein
MNKQKNLFIEEDIYEWYHPKSATVHKERKKENEK